MKTVKKSLFVITMLFMTIGLFACSSDEATVPKYTSVSESEYARDNKKCIAYRVAVDPDLSDDELIAVFNDVTDDDDYYLHTVYFYSDEDLATGADVYDVAMLEESEEGETPIIAYAN